MDPATMATDGDDTSARGRSDSDCDDERAIPSYNSVEDADEGGSSDEDAGSVEDAGEGVEELAIPPQKRKYPSGRIQDRTVKWRDHERFGPGEFTDEAFEDVKAELSKDDNKWTKGTSRTAKTGACSHSTEWRCGYKKSLGCPCVIRVEHVGDQVGVTVIRVRVDHVHSFDDDCSKTLPVKVKLVCGRFAQGQSKVRSMAIWEALGEAGINIESDFQMTQKNKDRVMSHVRYQRNKLEEDMHKNTYGALYNFALNHKVRFSELSDLDDLHKFVVFPGWDVDVEKKNICLGFSTPHLLQNMCRGDIICGDGTYRMTWQGNPVFVVGTVDYGQAFHPAAFFLLSSETNKNVLKVYEQTLEGATAMNPLGINVKESIKFSMNDNCDAIFYALDNALDHIENPGSCYVHMLRNVKKKKSLFSSDSSYDSFMCDLRFISQQSPVTKGLTNVLMKKLGEKWSTLEPTMWEWFEKENTGKVKGNWQRNMGCGVVRDNNGLESFNNKLKDDGTQRAQPVFFCLCFYIKDESCIGDRQDAVTFLANMKKYIPLQSKTDCEWKVVKLKCDDWRKAQVVLNQKGYLDSCTTTVGCYTVILSTAKWHYLTERDLDDVRLKAKIKKTLRAYSKYMLHNGDAEDYPGEIASRSLDEHADKLGSAYHLTSLTDRGMMEHGLASTGVPYLCSCPHYWHYYKCKHSLAMAIKNGDVEIPPQYRIDKIGKKRKAGRPKKAGGGQALAEKGAR